MRPSALLPLSAIIMLAHACAPAGRRPATAPGTAPAPNTFWTPPPGEPREPQEPATPSFPKELEEKAGSMTLVDVIDLALRNNPVTKAAWADARAAAAAYESEKGDFYPSINADANYSKYKTAATQGRQAVKQSVYGGTVSLSYLLLDFGGRKATIDAARSVLLAADWTHNAAIQDVVLQVELAYHQYMATKALHEAQKASFKEAATNLESANVRHDAGVATIADVLQAKTALSQAQLALDTLQGALQTTRGALAVSMGLAATIPFDIEEAPRDVPVDAAMDTVEHLIEDAVAKRPELMAMRAQVEAAVAHARDVRSDGLPSVSLNANAGRTYLPDSSRHGDNYSAGIFVRIPIFTGFSQTNNVREADARVDATRARAKGLENQVIYQVFAAYYSLKTATQRARTAGDLLASATQSEEVALERYRAGVGSILDLLAAQAALADARAQQIQARWDWYGSLAQLAHDSGVLGLHGESPIIPAALPVKVEEETK